MWHLFQQGGALMWPLLICSIIALTLLVERFFFWVSYVARVHSAERREVMKALEKGDISRVTTVCDGSKDPLLQAVSQVMTHPKAAIHPVMDQVSTTFQAPIRRFHAALDLIVAVSPLLGILGTVVGIILSFQMMGAGVQDPKAVTGGIAQALITTASGLAIAIVTMVIGQSYAMRGQKELEQFEVMMSQVERYYGHS